MSAGEPEEITLYSQLADWDDDSPEERGDGDDDLDFDCESSMMVERLGPNRMRLLEPCSIGRFGPFGPRPTGARFNAVLAAYCKRQCDTGKPERTALAAVAHTLIIILNAMMRNRSH